MYIEQDILNSVDTMYTPAKLQTTWVQTHEASLTSSMVSNSNQIQTCSIRNIMDETVSERECLHRQRLKVPVQSSCLDKQTNRIKGFYYQSQPIKSELNDIDESQEIVSVASHYVAKLKVCARKKDLDGGHRIHAEIVKNDKLLENVYIGSSLINMYLKCGELATAEKIFDELPTRNVVSWSVLISGYAQYGYGNEALKCYERMQTDGIFPNEVTFVCILKACGSTGAIQKGKQVHAQIVREGMLKKNVFVGNALVDMYAKCGCLAKAKEVFNELPLQNLVTWNSLITGYAQHGYSKETLDCFAQMQLEGFTPDAITFVCILKACSNIGAKCKGEEIHAAIVSEGLLEKDVMVANALMDMYSKFGAMPKAAEVFDQIPHPNLVSWNVLIAGYAEHGYSDKALKSFNDMKTQGFFPDSMTYLGILKACGSIGAVQKGELLHDDIIKENMMEKCVLLGTALVDMYAKCGLIARAEEVFDKLPVQDLVSWNVLLGGYSQLGNDQTVFTSFNKMINDGVLPDPFCFTIVLNTCSHSGLLNKGQMYFEMMIADYGITPNLEHYTCMVDLFGRAGQLSNAATVIMEMPFYADIAVWHTLLGACQKWKDVTLAELVFEQAIQLDQRNPVSYIIMSNIYLASGMKEDADKIERMIVIM